MSFLLGHTVPHEFILRPSHQKVLGMKRNILCPKPSIFQFNCVAVACVAVMSLAECESVPKYTCYVCPDSSQSL